MTGSCYPSFVGLTKFFKLGVDLLGKSFTPNEFDSSSAFPVALL
jgi:hypothetical protein